MTGRPYVETLVFLGGIAVDVRSWTPAHAEVDAPMVWASAGGVGPGGRGASAAVAAVKLGRRFVDLVGCVGDDFLGETIVGVLKDAGVSLRLVDRIPDTATGIQQVVIDDHGDRRTVASSNANSRVGMAQIRKADSTIFGADLLFATLEVPLATVKQVVAMAVGRNVPVLLNATPLPTVEGVKALGKELLSKVDVLLINWSEALLLADMNGVTGPAGVEVCKRILRLGPKAVVVTMGEHGSMVAIRGKHALIEPFSVNAIDTTAAGDAYAGAFAVGLTSQSAGNYNWTHLLKAGHFASAAAALCVSKPGGHSALPDRESVERLLLSQPREVRVAG